MQRSTLPRAGYGRRVRHARSPSVRGCTASTPGVPPSLPYPPPSFGHPCHPSPPRPPLPSSAPTHVMPVRSCPLKSPPYVLSMVMGTLPPSTVAASSGGRSRASAIMASCIWGKGGVVRVGSEVRTPHRARLSPVPNTGRCGNSRRRQVRGRSAFSAPCCTSCVHGGAGP